MKISLCLMVWNELPGCRLDVPRLPRQAFDEVYAVDGGSTDGTVAYLQEHGIPVHRQPRKSLNAAYWHAIDVSACDAVVVFFPKGTVPPEDLLKFRPLLEAGNDLVVASRCLPGSRNEEDARLWRPRKWAVQALALLASVCWRREGWRVRDVLHGVRAYTVSGFRRMDPGGEGVSIDIECVVRAYRQRLPRAEFPTTEVARPSGQSRFPFFKTGLKFMQYLLREARRPT